MITKTEHGYMVKSHTGKNLSRKDLSIKEARKRLKQIEMFKHMK